MEAAGKTRCSRHRIVPPGVPRMAARNAPERQPAATQAAMAADRFGGVFGTAGQKTAVRAQHGTDGVAIHGKYGQQKTFQLAGSGTGGFPLDGPASGATAGGRIRPKSWSSSARSALRSRPSGREFRRSTRSSGRNPARAWRNASRARRLTRLRSCARLRCRFATTTPRRGPVSASGPDALTGP